MELHHLDWEGEKAKAPGSLIGIIAPTSNLEAFETRVREAIDRGAYRKVAEIDGYEVSDVFRVTQNIDDNWSEKPMDGVRPTDTMPIRSTAVGDVIVDDGGMVHVVAAIGLIRLPGATFR